MTHPYLFGWSTFISKFNEQVRKSWPAGEKEEKGGKGGKKGGKEKKEAPKKEAKKDDDDLDDLFGDDNEDDAEAAKKAAAAAKEKGKEGAKKKKVVIAQSLVMFEVKPLDDQTNLDDLAKRIFSELEMDGCFWKTEYKKEPVAFGIFKLIIATTIEDDKVSVDNDLVEKIEAMDDMVQSVEILAFNKI